jgi:hypothetical protein
MIEARGQRKQAEQCNASEKVDPGARSVLCRSVDARAPVCRSQALVKQGRPC